MKVNIACVQESRAGSKAKDANRYKLWYSEVRKGKNGVSILVDIEFRECVVEVRRVNDRLMTIKLVVGECTFNVVSAYTHYASLDEEVKRRFWEGLDEIVRNVSPAERFPKRKEHFVTFQSAVAKTQIEYLHLRRCNRRMCKDCKVIPGEILAMQHRLFVMDVGIMLKRKKRFVRGRSRT
uniref:Uncharacterized protein LOC104210921 n=1 Tax=Nicotiana sylvestris TaxID=4096 RepID=A0A1U7V8Q7_NICSY|nr:PREDICTED: uncharacterized protein LOC104210921 [Nicotiana sylvestris]